MTCLTDGHSPRRLADLFDRPGTLRVTSLQLGVPIKTISERLGHASITTTMDTYAHLLPAMDRDAAVTFGEILREGHE